MFSPAHILLSDQFRGWSNSKDDFIKGQMVILLLFWSAICHSALRAKNKTEKGKVHQKKKTENYILREWIKFVFGKLRMLLWFFIGTQNHPVLSRIITLHMIKHISSIAESCHCQSFPGKEKLDASVQTTNHLPSQSYCWKGNFKYFRWGLSVFIWRENRDNWCRERESRGKTCCEWSRW